MRLKKLLLIKTKIKISKTLKISVKLIGTILVCWVLINTISLVDIKYNLNKCDIDILLLSFGLTFFCPFIISSRLFLFVKIFQSNCSFYSCVKSSMSGLSLNLFIPARGGDFIKIIYLKNEGRTKWSDLANAAIWERIFDVFALLFLGFLGSSLIGFSKLSYLLVFFILTLILSLLLLKRLSKYYISNSKIYYFFASSNYISENPTLTFFAFVNCLFCWLLNITIMALLLHSIDPKLIFLHSLAATPPSILSGILPISFWGIGVRDGALAYFLQGITTPEIAISAGFLYTALVYWLLGLIGTPFLLFAKRKPKESNPIQN